MTPWNWIEQQFKRHYLRLFEAAFGRTPVSPEAVDTERVRRILVVRQHDQLGDFLLSTSALRALRARFPEAWIGLVVRGYTEPVARHNRYVDELFVVPETLDRWTPAYTRDFARRLLAGWDVAVVLNTVSHSLTSDLIARFSRARWTVGPAHRRFPGTTRNFLYNVEVPVAEEVRHQSLRNVDIVRVLGADTPNLREEMTLLDSELAAMRRRLAEAGLPAGEHFVLVHPGAGKVRNRWPAERFGIAAGRLAKRFGHRVVVTWGPSEKTLADRVVRELGDQALAVAGLTLRQFAALCRLADLVLCNDTGSMHVAAAAGTPLVAVFGPTDPAEWKPWGEEFVAVRGHDLTCESVTVDQVVEAAERLLAESPLSG